MGFRCYRNDSDLAAGSSDGWAVPTAKLSNLMVLSPVAALITVGMTLG